MPAAEVEEVATSTESEETTDATADAATEAETESASSGSSEDEDDDDDGADAASISAYAAAGSGGFLFIVAIAIYLGTRKQRKTSGRWADISELGANVEAGEVPPPPIVVVDAQDAQSPLRHDDISLAQKKAMLDATLPAPALVVDSPMMAVEPASTIVARNMEAEL